MQSVLLPVLECAAFDGVHVGIHRHLHQPIYWGEPDPARPNQTQFGYDSQLNKDANNAYYGDTEQHPSVLLVGGNDSVFEDPDKQNAYQNWIKQSVGSMSDPDAGMTISFSGALQRDLWSFGRDTKYGYSPGWNNQNIEAHGWTTSGGHSKAEILGQTYNHAFSPLLPKSVLRKQIAMQRERTRKSWGMNADMSDQSKGFWPIELAFSHHMIDVLTEFGYKWVMIGNSHIARTCQNYESKAMAAGILKADPPNRADLLGPTVPDDQWYNNNRDSYGNAFPVPFAYQMHRAKYVNPETGVESKIIIAPQCDYHGYQSGYSQVGWADIDGKISEYNDPDQPSLVMLTNDGENFWGGGSSFWTEFAPQFMNEASSHGKKATTIGQFLADHPPPADDIVHVEDGSWLAADQGSPQFYRWLEPPRTINNDDIDPNDPNTFFDLENGWHQDMRNWAVMFAGINYCETAEQITLDGGGEVQVWRIEEPYQDDGTYNNPNAAEQAWHFLMWGFDSGFLYFNGNLQNDDAVKHTFAANRAKSLAEPVIGDASGDATPPTTFKPQRFPWNPGGKGRGQYLGVPPYFNSSVTVGYETDPWPSDFYIWTLAYDVSGISSVTLKVRVDNDGTNPLDNNDNETYAGGASVGSWVSMTMNRRVLPKDDPTNNDGLNLFREPDAMADYYWVKVNGYRNKLLDYYIETVDSKGNTHKSEIQHVYVEDDGTSPSPVTFSDSPSDCTPLVTTYDSTGRPLSAESPVFLQISFNNGTDWSRYQMADAGSGVWTYTNTVPDDAPSAIVWFENTAGSVSDSNEGSNWNTGITDCGNPSTVEYGPAEPSGCVNVTITYHPNEGPLELVSPVHIAIGRDGWNDVIEPNPAMSAGAGGSWTYTYSILPGTEELNLAFNDGEGTWDNNGGSDWSLAVTACPDIVITNPASGISVANNIATYDLSGVANPSLRGSLLWSNKLNGVTGSLPSALNWSALSLGLGVGTNEFTVSGTMTGSAVIATDTASNTEYTDGWDNGDNGGSGWGGGWSLTTSGGSAGHFHAETPGNSFLSIGADGWGLWANSGDTSVAVRAFSQAMSVGDTLSLKFDNNYIDTGKAVGICLQNNAGDDLLVFKFVGGGADYVIDDQTAGRDTGVGYTSDGLDLAFEVTATGQYLFMIGATEITGTLAANADQAVRKIKLFNGSAGNDENHNFYVTDLELTGSAEQEVTSDPVLIIRQGSAFVDTDHDGIDDDWEMDKFENLDDADENSDWDKDGSSDRDESYAGTHPKSASSSLALHQLDYSGPNPTITWDSVGGKTYTLRYTTNLMASGGGWIPLTQVTENGVSAGVETTRQHIDTTVSPGDTMRMYNVRLDAP
ncbi:MAG: hypothetical protein KJ626_01785 [Verrucomicrobia bacterium]|nr:hypothetical protein [Verrucomicrobiota bacterium]